MATQNNSKNENKVFTSKITGIQLTEAELTDLLNESSVIKKAGENSEYNYKKIADNLPIICQIIGVSVSESLLKAVANDKKNFVECKTKEKLSTHPEFSNLKKKIRNKVREYFVNKQISDKAKTILKKLIF